MLNIWYGLLIIKKPTSNEKTSLQIWNLVQILIPMKLSIVIFIVYPYPTFCIFRSSSSHLLTVYLTFFQPVNTVYQSFRVILYSSVQRFEEMESKDRYLIQVIGEAEESRGD